MTSIVREHVKNGKLEIKASNDIFGDPWPNVVKTFVVFYQYDVSRIYTAVSMENELLTIEYNNESSFVDDTKAVALRVVGAIYGKKDVTAICNKFVQSNQVEIPINNSVFGDGLPGIVKSFIALSKKGEDYHLAIGKEGGIIKLDA